VRIAKNAHQFKPTTDMNTHHYETESHMRADNPYIANHLATIAQNINGIMTAQLDGKIYSWNDNNPAAGSK